MKNLLDEFNCRGRKSMLLKTGQWKLFKLKHQEKRPTNEIPVTQVLAYVNTRKYDNM